MMSKSLKKTDSGARYNLIDRILNYFEDFEPITKLKLRYLRIAVFMFIFWELVDHRAKFRDLVPNAINPFNHAGNLDSTVIALLASILIGILLTRLTYLSPKQIKLSLMAATLLVCLLVNSYVELPIGMAKLNLPNTGDIWDVVWPTALGLLQTYLCLDVELIPKKSVKAT